MNPTDLEGLARARRDLHKGHASSRRLAPGYELTGLSGEKALADFTGGEVDTQPRPGGDGGVDAHIALWFTADVKTSKLGIDMLVEEGEVKADLYIAGHDQAGKTTLIGWAWARQVRAVPPRDVCGRGVISHQILREDLRPMSELAVRLVRGEISTESPYTSGPYAKKGPHNGGE